MAITMYIVLDDEEIEALTTLSERHLRYPKEQIRLFVREGLERCGLLPKTQPLPEAQPEQAKVT